MTSTENLNLTFNALSDPTRRALLQMVSKGEKSVSELAEPFLHQMSLPAITKHLKVLERAHLISRSQNAQWRPCRLNSAPLQEVHSWMAQFQKYWEDSLDRLDEYLKTMEEPEEINQAIESADPARSQRKTKVKKRTKSHPPKMNRRNQKMAKR